MASKKRAAGGHSAKKGSSSQRRKKGKGTAKRKRKGVEEPPAVIDPDLAVVIKRPIRVQIVALGHQRPISPVEFSEAFGYPLDYISDQFKALVAADFLELVEEVKVRGTVKHMYRSTKRAFVSDTDWSLLDKPIQDELSGGFVHDLNARLADADEAGTLNARPDRCLFWIALTLDEISWPEFTKMLAWVIDEGKELDVQTVERHVKGEGKGVIPVTFAVLGFESPKESERKELKPGERRRREAPKARAKTKGVAAKGKRKPKGKGKPKAKGKSRDKGQK